MDNCLKKCLDLSLDEYFYASFCKFGNAVICPVLTQHLPQFYYGSHLNHIIIIIINIIIVTIVIVMTIIIIRIIFYFLNDFYGTLPTVF